MVFGFFHTDSSEELSDTSLASTTPLLCLPVYHFVSSPITLFCEDSADSFATFHERDLFLTIILKFTEKAHFR
jgi:hypothetical protein